MKKITNKTRVNDIIEIITLVLPSTLGLKIYYNLNKKTSKLELLMYFLVYILFTNFLCMCVLLIFKPHIYNLIVTLENSIRFCVKFIVLSIIINIALSIISTIISKYFSFNIEIEHEKKHSKNKKNN